MATDRIVDLSRGGDLMTRRMVEAEIIKQLSTQRAGLERFLAEMFGRYHEAYHGTPPLAKADTETPS